MDFENTIISKFAFLMADKGFAEPKIISNEKSYIRGVAFRKNKLIIEITNSSHPADYGFEIKMRSSKKSDRPIKIYSKAKEEQDKELRFLDEGAEKVKSLLS